MTDKYIAKLRKFVEENKEFKHDFETRAEQDVLKKYNIPYSFYRAAAELYGFKKNRELVKQRQDTARKSSVKVMQESNSDREAEFTERLLESIKNTEQAKQDYSKMFAQEFMTKYSISKRIYALLKTKCGFEQDNQIILSRQQAERAKTLSTRDLAAEAQRRTERKLERFIVDNPQFVSDYRLMTDNDLITKYSITYGFIAQLAKYHNLQKDETALEEQRANKWTASMQQGGFDKRKRTLLSTLGVEVPMQSPVIQRKVAATSKLRYGVNTPLLKEGSNSPAISRLNRWFAELLTNKGLDVKLERAVGSYSYDLIINEKLLLDINPTISHCYEKSYSQITIRGNQPPIDRNEHYRRWLNAKNNGFQLLSMFDWYDIEDFVEFILSKVGVHQTTIGARKLTIQRIEKQVANQFYEVNHLLGKCNNNSVNLALVDKAGTVYSLMSFGKPRVSKKYDFELLRFANLIGYSVPGAASKLFKAFMQEHEGATIVTYSDNNLGLGNVYSVLGFVEKEQTGPSVRWCKLKLHYDDPVPDNIKDISLVRQGADRLMRTKVKDYFPVGLSKEDFEARGGKEEYRAEYAQNSENAEWWPSNQNIVRHYGYYPVADCGSTKWVFEPSVQE